MNKALDELRKLSNIYANRDGDSRNILLPKSFCEMIQETLLSDVIPLTPEERAREEGMKALILTREGGDSLSPFEGVARQLLVEAS